MLITPDSHLDHGLTERQVAHIAERYADREAFFIDTFELPAELGTVPSGLHGPLAGDPPVPEDEVTYQRRGERKGLSRLVARPPRQQRLVTVVGGPHEGKVILYTAYGGPCAPREPFDVEDATPAIQAQSRVFWRKHALSA